MTTTITNLARQAEDLLSAIDRAQLDTDSTALYEDLRLAAMYAAKVHDVLRKAGPQT